MTARSVLMMHAAGGALALLLGLAAPSPAAADTGIRVSMNYARILQLDRDVAKVIIGNPEIADVAVSDPNTIVLTGRSYGVTNLVIIDGVGNTLVDERIIVGRDSTNQLRLYRNTEPTILTCSPSCEKPTTGTAAAATN